MNLNLAPETPGLKQPAQEQILVRFRRHGKTLIFPTLALLLAALLLGLYGGSFPQFWQNLLLYAAVLVLAGGGFGMPYIVWLSAKSTITTQRIIARTGVLTRVRQEVFINRVRSVSSRRTLLQRLCGSGSIEIYTIGAQEALVLQDVPDMKNIAEVLQQLVAESYLADQAAGHYGALTSHPQPSFTAAVLPQQPPQQHFTAQRKM